MTLQHYSSQTTMIRRWNWWQIAVGIIAIATNGIHAQSHKNVLDRIDEYHDITILGLGSMGQAVVKCLLKNNKNNNDVDDKTTIKVHAWNRGIEKRNIVREMGTTITVYETAEAAVQASNITLIFIDDWDGIIQLITKDIQSDVWSNNNNNNNNNNDKVVVLFSTYSPADIIQLQNKYFVNNSNIVLVGGAVVGVPETVCTPKALILLSANIPQIHSIGRVEVFMGNVGYAALVNMALILVITFGIAGQELAHLIIQQFGIINSAEFYKTYISLATDIGPEYTKMLLPILSNSIVSKEYEKSYVPVGTFRNVLQMHVTFMKEIGIVDDTFLTSYLQHLNKVTNKKYGPAAWIEEINIVANTNLVNNNDLEDKMEEREL